MQIVDNTADLAALCGRLAGHDYVTVDTEFMRDSSYWPKLCLLQIAGPEEAAIVDPLAGGIDLEPLYALMSAPSVLKVFHAARQDIEIFFHQGGAIPAPVFDSQVAAMVCGFGDAVSYEKLVAKLLREKVDKSSRFTDWARRPLSGRQLDYALNDVVHLCGVYEKLARRLKENGRTGWLAEEMAGLTNPATYDLAPELAWQRLKSRSSNRRYLGVLTEVAAWREREAQERDVPRRRVIRDDALMELAAHQPDSREDLEKMRAIGKGVARGRYGAEILKAVRAGMDLPEKKLPKSRKQEKLPSSAEPVLDLLKVLLKAKCRDHGVAQKLVCTTAQLETFVMDKGQGSALLKGWRKDVFGADALALMDGRLALSASQGSIRLSAPAELIRDSI